MTPEDQALTLGRDISHGETVEKELDILVSRRHEKRVKSEGERRAEEAWQESERPLAEERREANRRAWASYRRRQAERHRATLTDLISHHEALAEKLKECREYRENEHHKED